MRQKAFLVTFTALLISTALTYSNGGDRYPRSHHISIQIEKHPNLGNANLKNIEVKMESIAGPEVVHQVKKVSRENEVSFFVIGDATEDPLSLKFEATSGNSGGFNVITLTENDWNKEISITMKKGPQVGAPRPTTITQFNRKSIKLAETATQSK